MNSPHARNVDGNNYPLLKSETSHEKFWESLLSKTLIIAEVGNNHEGNFDMAQELVRQAADSGVDAVKFQTFIPELFVSLQNPQGIERLKKFQLSFHQFEKLGELARKLGLLFVSTPLDTESATFLSKIVDIMKIASGDNTCYPFLDHVASLHRPTILSTGMTDIPTIQKSISRFQHLWSGIELQSKLALLHCVTSYPAEIEYINLKAMDVMKEELGLVVGYSDHTLGIETCLTAVAAGAQIIEKHFTLDHNTSTFRDHQLSANPTEMKALVHSIRKIEKTLGRPEKKPQSCELEFQISARRSIGICRDLKAGEVINESDLTWLRPGNGVQPGSEKLFVGKTLARSIKKGELLKLEDLTS